MPSVRKKRAQNKRNYRLRKESITAAQRAKYWANPEKYREYSRLCYWNDVVRRRRFAREYSRVHYWKKKVASVIGKTPVQGGQRPSPSDITTWPATADPTWSGDTTTNTKASNSDHGYHKCNNPCVSLHHFHYNTCL